MTTNASELEWLTNDDAVAEAARNEPDRWWLVRYHEGRAIVRARNLRALLDATTALALRDIGQPTAEGIEAADKMDRGWTIGAPFAEIRLPGWRYRRRYFALPVTEPCADVAYVQGRDWAFMARAVGDRRAG